MLTVLDHITLAHSRACKNRTTMHFALERAHQHIPDPDQIEAIEDAYVSTARLIDQLHAILTFLGRKPGPTQP